MKPECPQCGNSSPKSIAQIADTYKCGKCGALFDGNPDEGGTHYNDPTMRLQKQEYDRQRRQQPRRQRR